MANFGYISAAWIKHDEIQASKHLMKKKAIAQLNLQKLRIAFINLLAICAITGCGKKDDQQHKKVDSTAPEIHTDEYLPATVKIEPPKGLKLQKNILHRTTYIGTSDHPTIDGGIINAADGLPVTQDVPPAPPPPPPQPKTVEKIANAKPEQTKTPTVAESKSPSSNEQPNNRKRFADDWARSDKVKIVLEQAAKDGKLDYVLKQSSNMGLPASVAVVPMIESNYRETAVSEKGAGGVWQLMPSVAKDYGISNQERFQFIPSTTAALQLLNQLHQQFGSWELAFAAYHAGAARVARALSINPTANSVQDLPLPWQTKQYVSRLMRLNLALSSMD